MSEDPTLQKYREYLSRPSKNDYSDFNREAQKRAVETRRQDDAWIREQMEERGAFDSWRTHAERDEIRREAERELQESKQEKRERVAKDKESARFQTHHDRIGNAAQVQELIDQVKANGTVTAKDKIRWVYLTKKVARTGEDVPELQSFLDN